MTPLELQEKIQKDPVYVYDEILNCPHWSAQDRITRAVFKFQRVAVKGSHGWGKSYIAARIGITFLLCHKDSIVITTAPTFRQVETIIWREWRGACNNALFPIGGNMLKTSHEINTNWYAMGLSSDKPDAFQGIHSTGGHILVICDETTGIEHDILQTIEALLTSKNVHLLYLGNPTRGEGLFYEAFKKKSFYKLSVSVFDTPNFTKNNIKNVEDLQKFKKSEELESLQLETEQLVTPLWAWERMEDWGADSPIFKSRVLSEFPEESSDTLIPLYQVENAINKQFEEKILWNLEKSIGIDVARFGDDKTVFTAIRTSTEEEYEHMETEVYEKKDTMQIVGRAIAMFNRLGFNKEFDYFIVDDTGVGGGVSDRLLELGFNVIKINFGEGSDDDRFLNKKAEIFWKLRDLFKNKKIKLLDRGSVVAELSIIRYDYTSKSQLFIVSKKEMKKKGFKSPDHADSLALACSIFAKNYGNNYDLEEDKEDKENKTIVGNILNKNF